MRNPLIRPTISLLRAVRISVKGIWLSWALLKFARGHPHMTSARVGGWRSAKSRHMWTLGQLGRPYLVLWYLRSFSGHRRRVRKVQQENVDKIGQKVPKFWGRHMWMVPPLAVQTAQYHINLQQHKENWTPDAELHFYVKYVVHINCAFAAAQPWWSTTLMKGVTYECDVWQPFMASGRPKVILPKQKELIGKGSMDHVDQLNSADSETYQSQLPQLSVGQFGLIKWAGWLKGHRFYMVYSSS